MNELDQLARTHDLTTMGGWRDNGDPAPYWEAWPEQLLALANAIEAKAAAKEREACAHLCEGLWHKKGRDGLWSAGWSDGSMDYAAAIRARGATDA